MRRGILLGTVLVVTMAAGAAWWQAKRTGSSSDSSTPATLDCPREVDLGRVEMHRVTEAVFPILNTGGQPLTIRNVTASCGCLGVRLLPARQEVTPNTTVVVQPGGEIELAFALHVSGVHGVKVGHVIRFSTDDPNHPNVEVRLTFVPTASAFSDHATLSFGEVAYDGAIPAATVGLFSTNEQEAVAVQKVVATDPGRVRVTYLPEPEGVGPVAAEAMPGSRRFGQVRVELVGLKPGDRVDAQVRVYAEGKSEPILAIPVAAHCSTPVNLAPEVLYLPRSSLGGPVYSGVVQCRASGSSPFSLEFGPMPAGVKVQAEDIPGNPVLKHLVVECDPALIADKEVSIPLTARKSEREYKLELRVVVDKR